MSDTPDATSVGFDPQAWAEQMLERVTQAERTCQRALDQFQRAPEPYAELVARVQAVEASNDLLRRVQSSLEVLVDHQTTPQLTVRHWRDEQGHWRYETTVSLKPESLEAMPNTLAWVDDMARTESARREGVDRG